MRRVTLCVTLVARTVEGTKAAAQAARDDGADLAEVRFDRWSEEERARAAELFPSPIPLLATYRSVAEGGEGRIDPDGRAAVLERLRALPFAAVDRERVRDPAPSRPEAGRSVGSRHLSAPVDWAGVGRFLEQEGPRGERQKIVAPASIAEFLGPFRATRTGPDPPEGIVLATGAAGPLSRVWPDHLATSWVFASPGPHDPVADEALEPAQVPVDRLRSVFRRAPPGPLFAVIGHPIGFSESPRLHHSWLRADGYDGAYLALDVETEREFRDLLEVLGPGGFRGVNVTHPWKGLARAIARDRELAVDEAEAANTLTWDGESWAAALTDVDAVARRLAELRADGEWAGDELTLLGAGAAARATIVAARRRGTKVRVLARRPSETEALQRRFPETVVPGSSGPAALVVHATPVGRATDDRLAIDLGTTVGPGTQWLDFVYGPMPSSLRPRVESLGGRFEDGRSLLRYQAEESYRRWWGHRPTRPELPEAPA